MTSTSVRTSVERSGPPDVPAVSVCIPVFNKARFVGETIRSILAQTYGDFEVVVLENASTDGSADVIRAFDDPRIVLAHNERTVPLVDNFNRVVAASRAPLVKVINADDMLEPEALARQVAVLDEDAAVSVVSCRQSIVDEDGAVFTRGHCLRTPDLIGRQDRETVVRRVARHGFNPIGNPGNGMFRRSAFEACGGWRGEGIVLDITLWTELTRYGDFYGIPEDLAVFRLAPLSHSTSARTKNILRTRRFIRDLMREHADVLRFRDRVASVLRIPVTVVGSQMFFAASAAPGTLTHRIAAQIVAARQRPTRA